MESRPRVMSKRALLTCRDLDGHCDQCCCHGGLTQQYLQTQSYRLGTGRCFGKKEPLIA